MRMMAHKKVPTQSTNSTSNVATSSRTTLPVRALLPHRNTMRFLGRLLQTLNGLKVPDAWVLEMNRWLPPSALTQDVLGAENWIDPESLGPSGVNGVLDNRHISSTLHEMLCDDGIGGEALREYFGTLVGLAWPSQAEFHLCCSQPAGKEATLACLDPDYAFGVDDEPPALAPHFLTPAFGPEQQEVLTAALVSKFNVHGTQLAMEVAGRLDLGAAGLRFLPREDWDDFPHELGQAWGNMFLDCLGDDADHVLCQASVETDRAIGRNPDYHPYALFTCSGQHEDYPVKEMGKSCFSEDMDTNDKDGCGLVAAVGPCERVCVAGFCGINQPPIEGHGTTNVLYVYMGEASEQEDGSDMKATEVALIVVAVMLFVFLIAAAYFQAKKRDKVTTMSSSKMNPDEEATIADTDAEETTQGPMHC